MTGVALEVPGVTIWARAHYASECADLSPETARIVGAPAIDPQATAS